MIKKQNNKESTIDNVLQYIPTGILTAITRDLTGKDVKNISIKSQYIEINQKETTDEEKDSLLNLLDANIQVKAFVNRQIGLRRIEVKSVYKIKTNDPDVALELKVVHTISAKFPYSADPKLIDRSLVDYILIYQAAQLININFKEFNCAVERIEFPTSIKDLESSDKVQFDGYTQNFRRNYGVPYQAV